MNTISPRLDLRQGQTLVMTPQLQQAIKLLQMNNVELQEFIEGEVAHNPLLEKGEAEGADGGDEAPPVAESRDDMAAEFDAGWTGNEQGDGAALQDFDAGSAMATVGAGGSRAFEGEGFEHTMTRPETLREHLHEQLRLAFEDSREQMLGALLIDMLDEAGYLRPSLADLRDRLGVKDDRLDRILARLKQFTPTGVFATDLRECLALQLEEQGRLDAPMAKLLDHLDPAGGAMISRR